MTQAEGAALIWSIEGAAFSPESRQSLIWRGFAGVWGHQLHNTPLKKTATLRWLRKVLGRTSLGDLNMLADPWARDSVESTLSAAFISCIPQLGEGS